MDDAVLVVLTESERAHLEALYDASCPPLFYMEHGYEPEFPSLKAKLSGRSPLLSEVRRLVLQPDDILCVYTKSELNPDQAAQVRAWFANIVPNQVIVFCDGADVSVLARQR